ncbi:septum formation protein [Alteribacillus persepolensis]|uniref:dTTP/UTP pyrophosphatase n=1 Tax=Alteribacillus persepolensis TaxID=568899 RepID=A0A1G8GPX2_9BACI|nr:Maf family protein [Alteribacillus persepolensis]SDH96311.1 septum formation protein [Alteribacillus persepolensis]
MPSLLLASQSPRRKQLLKESGFSFVTQASYVSEEVPSGFSPVQTVEELARRKAESVFCNHPDKLVIGADTVVACGSDILGKPKTKEEARQMLCQLSAASHEVYSGTALISKHVKKVFHVKTEVVFYPLDEALVEAYIATEEPFDKAGAYGIQGRGRLFVKKLNGDYFNVVGLPIARVARELEQCGIYPAF